ncbi:MAG TPA: trypsin-like peptidase domain-containing protein [Solirubrobacterales bacterium]
MPAPIIDSMVEKAKSFSRTPLGSGVVGGLVVAVLGWVAIAAGLVHAPSNNNSTLPAPLTPAPVNAKVLSGGGDTVAKIYKADSSGVAFVQAEQRPRPASPFDLFGGGSGGGTATGSGFVIDTDGHILTNNHVVSGAQSIHVKLGGSNTSYDAQVVGKDPATDLALLKISAPSSDLHPLSLGDSSSVQVGDPVVAIGNPFGLDQTATTGIVSALQRQIQAPNGFAISNVIQTDASINPGNSGGPLLNSAGQVIGITSQIETGGGNGSVGIGFAIPSNTARQVVSQLETNGKVEHAFLGITGATISPDIAKALNLPVDSGVLVQQAVNGGPAAKAGIHGGHTAATIQGANMELGGDIITEIGGHKITSMDQVVNIVNSAKPGDTLDVTVRRGADTKSVTVTLGDRPSSIGTSGSGLGR